MDAEVSFGRWLEKRRKALDLTREKLAKKVGCSISALCKIETDQWHPSKQLAELLACALHIPEDERAVFIRIARGEVSLAKLKFQPVIPDFKLRQLPNSLSKQIPIPVTPLIGRETELATLRQMLGDSQCRLITLVGPGGVGKTRLAIELARSWYRASLQCDFRLSRPCEFHKSDCLGDCQCSPYSWATFQCSSRNT